MAIFFLLVGLEIKRELIIGEFSERRSAALPLVAALGGMVMPALHGVHHAFLVSIDLEDGLVEVEVPAIRLRYRAEQLRVMKGVQIGEHVGLLSLREGEMSVAPMKWPEEEPERYAAFSSQGA